MNAHKFMVEEIRFHLSIPDTLVFTGWFYDGSTKDHTLTVQLDGRDLSVVKLLNKGVGVSQKYIHCVNEISEEVIGIVKLPKNWKKGRRLSIHSTYQGKPHRDAVYAVTALLRLENQIQYCIENVRRTEETLVVNGWCIGGGEIKLSLLDAGKQPVPVKIDHFYKSDTERTGPEDENRQKLFFSARSDSVKGKTYYLQLRGAKSSELVRLDKWAADAGAAGLWRRSRKVFHYLKRNGIKATLVKIRDRFGNDKTAVYRRWRKKYGVTAKQLEEQRNTQALLPLRPRFSIVVPLFRTEEAFLRELFASVQNQTYDNWELCLADGSGDGGKGLSPVISEYREQDSRIRCRVLEKNYGIAGNTNGAIEMAEGDYIVLADHDDTLSPDALYEFAKAISEDPSTDVLYSDEDKVDMTGKKYFEPHFKPGYDPDFLLTNNYICHLFAVKRDIVDRVGGIRDEYNGSQDYDFILRCCEAAQKVHHVPRVLYHWRCHFDSTAANPQSKLYAFEAGRRAVEAHFRRLNIPAEVRHAQFNGLYRTYYQWPQKPPVSVIIPNKDHTDRLSDCIRSVLLSRYPACEIIVAEHDSVRKETFAFYKKMTEEHDNIRIVTCESGSRFSDIIRTAEKEASGGYLLLLSRDVQMADENCIGELLGHCMRDDVGVTGARIVYDNDTVMHAGIVPGLARTAGYVFRGESRYTTGYESRILCAQNYSAVTAACMMIRRSVYHMAGGMTAELPDAFCDIDFCLKVRELGLLIVYNPGAELICRAAAPDCPAPGDNADFPGKDISLLPERWKKLSETTDPYYNPNLTHEKLDFSLRR